MIEHTIITTWDHAIRVADTDPTKFAIKWSLRRHRRNGGPFNNRDPATLIFRNADANQLMQLRPVASANLTMRPVAPEDAEEVVLRAFYGTLVAAFDQDIGIELAYIGEPITTSRWMDAMALLYPDGSFPQDLPRLIWQIAACGQQCSMMQSIRSAM